MRKTISLFLFVGILVTLTASKTPNVDEKYIDFDKNLYVSKYETTNLEFRQFLEELKAQEDYKLYYPDTVQWTNKFTYTFNEPYTYMYFWHPSYNNYPVVNISKEAIDKYCKWMTEQYNLNPKKNYEKVIFRLPTEKEWLRFSSPLPGHNLPWYGNFPYVESNDDCTIFLANIKIKDYVTGSYNYVQDGAMITLKGGNYKANKLGLYDIIGNVAEITSEGILKGGSWDNTIEECMIDKAQEFQLPDPRVGFRLVMEVIEK